ncbi:MAG TPA: hypothetical protein VN622_07935 [Clostridia bacterium]|nr:hypothetical protein [Clostridia bacterium]
MSNLRLYSVVLGGATVALVGVTCWLRSHKKTEEQREHERRQRISLTGRITDGTVIDVHESTDELHGTIQLLIYQYDVAGVSYECSQDVTYLRQFIDLHSCRIGLPTSIKYDPHNPGNSIVISEEWSGLRKSSTRSLASMDKQTEFL